jgi:HEPN domain-containing protein
MAASRRRDTRAWGDVEPDESADWLHKRAPREWIQAALAELRRATTAFEGNDWGAGVAGCKRAAGMALNGALAVEPNEAWGRSYVDHVRALAGDETVPAAVRDACKVILETRPPNRHLLTLRAPSTHTRVVEAARDVMAHALAVVIRHEAG